MTAWVALLRGVNVGGITIRNAELIALFQDVLGLKEVRTFLASGNVRFETDASGSRRGEVKDSVEAALRERFRYDAWIVLVTVVELGRAIEKFPFDEADPTRQPWVIFCVDPATRDELLAAAASLDPSVDPVAAGPGVVYWNPVKGTTTDTPFAKILARATYTARTTTRNLRTLGRIVTDL
jgi:uncharacterized protein (DUF1697 family)